MAFLPVDRPTATANTGSYFKLQDGDNRIRILSDAVVGFVYWTNENKPVRVRQEPMSTPTNIRVDEKTGQPSRIKLFWAMVVWDYTTFKVGIWEVTQRTIQDQIEGLAEDDDWGHPRDYDLKINKSGKDLETKYNVIPGAKKTIAPEIESALAESTIDLQSIFSEDAAIGQHESAKDNSTFGKFERMLNRAKSIEQVDMAIKWAQGEKQMPAMAEVLGSSAMIEIARIGDARKIELTQTEENYEDIPF